MVPYSRRAAAFLPPALQLMSVACLYLGGKVEDSPKSVRDVLMASCELRYRDGARRLQHERVCGAGGLRCRPCRCRRRRRAALGVSSSWAATAAGDPL